MKLCLSRKVQKKSQIYYINTNSATNILIGPISPNHLSEWYKLSTFDQFKLELTNTDVDLLT